MKNTDNFFSQYLSSDEINKIEEFRKSKQTAMLAILFSDVVNSTYATEKLGEQNYSTLRHIHDELFKRIMTRDKVGIIIKEIGDSFLCVFTEPSTAVIRAIEFQRAIYANKKHLTIDNFTIAVRIGIHIGQVVVENNLALDIFGRHVNRAARIQAIANGGQILASQAIWENAIGWLKDNNDNNIEYIYYGKINLKGIDEKIDIYEFYPKEFGKPDAPNVFKKQNKNKKIFIMISFMLLIISSFLIFNKLNQIKKNSPVVNLAKPRKSFYVQFDFSDLRKQADYKAFFIDTLSLSENILSQVISVLYPDSVVTESDLIQLSSKKGVFYSRHVNKENNLKYFGDTLKFSGSLFIEAKKTASIKNDSIILKSRLEIYPEDRILSSNQIEHPYNLKKLESDFRNDLRESLFRVSADYWTVQGHVVSCNDSVFLFRVSKNAKLRTGAMIRFCREYKDNEGLVKRLEDIKKYIDYCKGKPQYKLMLENYVNEYNEKKKLSHAKYKQQWCQGVDDLKGNVIKLYDSTGIASWNLINKFPFERPKAGDIIYITY